MILIRYNEYITVETIIEEIPSENVFYDGTKDWISLILFMWTI